MHLIPFTHSLTVLINTHTHTVVKSVGPGKHKTKSQLLHKSSSSSHHPSTVTASTLQLTTIQELEEPVEPQLASSMKAQSPTADPHSTEPETDRDDRDWAYEEKKIDLGEGGGEEERSRGVQSAGDSLSGTPRTPDAGEATRVRKRLVS